MPVGKYKKLYLDVCAYGRPFDDQSQMRVKLETDAYYLILSGINDGKYRAIISSVHREEVSAIKDMQERLELLLLFDDIQTKVSCRKADVRKRAEQLYALGFGIADAAHVAYAEHTADVFISCDDKLLKKCKKEDILIPTFNPVEFALSEDMK